MDNENAVENAKKKIRLLISSGIEIVHQLRVEPTDLESV